MVRQPSLPCPQEGLGVFPLYEEMGECADSAAKSPTSYASKTAEYLLTTVHKSLWVASPYLGVEVNLQWLQVTW